MKATSFKMWRKKTNGRATKHAAFRSDEVPVLNVNSKKQLHITK